MSPAGARPAWPRPGLCATFPLPGGSPQPPLRTRLPSSSRASPEFSRLPPFHAGGIVMLEEFSRPGPLSVPPAGPLLRKALPDPLSESLGSVSPREGGCSFGTTFHPGIWGSGILEKGARCEQTVFSVRANVLWLRRRATGSDARKEQVPHLSSPPPHTNTHALKHTTHPTSLRAPSSSVGCACRAGRGPKPE